MMATDRKEGPVTISDSTHKKERVMKDFSLVLVAMMFIVGCGDRTTKEAATDTTAAHTPSPTGGDPAGQMGGSMKGQNDSSAMNGAMMMSGDMEKDMAMMTDMMVKKLDGSDSHYDHRFIDLMIPHHEGAIMMAKDALAHANKPELKQMARNVITSQQTEIDEMKNWRAKWYGENTPNGMANSDELKTHMQSMNDMMVEKLGQNDAGYEDRFIDMMIPHHEAAITMAGDALGKATHPEIKKLGQDIIDAQKTEIAQMEQWRKQWYGH